MRITALDYSVVPLFALNQAIDDTLELLTEHLHAEQLVDFIYFENMSIMTLRDNSEVFYNWSLKDFVRYNDFQLAVVGFRMFHLETNFLYFPYPLTKPFKVTPEITVDPVGGAVYYYSPIDRAYKNFADPSVALQTWLSDLYQAKQS